MNEYLVEYRIFVYIFTISETKPAGTDGSGHKHCGSGRD